MGGPAAVDVAKVVKRPIFENVTAVGTLLAQESVTLRPEIAGVIESAPFNEGQVVKKGDLLIKLDDDIQRAELAQAEAGLGLARSNFGRSQRLGRSGAASRQSIQETQVQAAVAAANVQAAQARLAKTELRAPVDGRVGIRRFSPGNWVSAGEELVTVETLNPLKLDFSVPEIFLRQMQTGIPVTIAVDALGHEEFSGKITVIDPRIDEATRTLRLRVEIQNDEFKLRSGLFARVNIKLKDEASSLVVPEAAIVPLGDKSFVFRIIDNKAQRVEVKAGLRNAGDAEIISGLKEGDSVVVAGQMRVKEGAPVQVRISAGQRK